MGHLLWHSINRGNIWVKYFGKKPKFGAEAKIRGIWMSEQVVKKKMQTSISSMDTILIVLNLFDISFWGA